MHLQITFYTGAYNIHRSVTSIVLMQSIVNYLTQIFQYCNKPGKLILFRLQPYLKQAIMYLYHLTHFFFHQFYIGKFLNSRGNFQR